jgi:hypothetical protein
MDTGEIISMAIPLEEEFERSTFEPDGRAQMLNRQR